MKAAIVTCGIYLFDTNSQKILVCHATRSRWNNWSIPKGLPEGDEAIYSAAVRELYEETGIVLNQLPIVAVHTLEAVTYQKQHKILNPFLVVTDSDLSKQLLVCKSLTEKGFPEIDKWKWVSLEEAGAILHEAQLKNISRIQELIASINSSK